MTPGTMDPERARRMIDEVCARWPDLPTVGVPVGEDIRDAEVVLRVYTRLRRERVVCVDLVLALERCGEVLSGMSRTIVVNLTTGRGSPTLQEINDLAFEICQLHGPRADLVRRLWRTLAGRPPE